MVNVRKPTVIGVNVEHIDTSSMIFSSIFLGGKCSLVWMEHSLPTSAYYNLLYDAVAVVGVVVLLSQRDGETFTYLLSDVK